MSEHSEGYLDAELRAIREEHGLTVPVMAAAMRCDKRLMSRYLNGTRPVPSCRWRLLKLELGIEQPYWTQKKRTDRLMAEYILGETP